MKKIFLLSGLIAICVSLLSSCKAGAYKEENGKIYYYHYAGVGVTFKDEVQGADLATFEELTEFYGKDKNHVYKKSVQLKDSDPETFELLEEGYSRDKNNVYWSNLKIEGADPKTHEIINEDYSKDKQSVFFTSHKLEQADPKSFEYISDRYYWRDKEHVFRYDSIMPNADPETLEKLTLFIWKDKNYVFHCGKIIPQAEAKSFKQLSDCWFADKNAIYYQEQRIDEDPEEFELIDDVFWARSKSNYYCQGELVVGLDYPTAEVLMVERNPTEASAYIKDKDKVFYRNKLVLGADPKTFVVEHTGHHGHDATNSYDGAHRKHKR